MKLLSRIFIFCLIVTSPTNLEAFVLPLDFQIKKFCGERKISGDSAWGFSYDFLLDDHPLSLKIRVNAKKHQRVVAITFADNETLNLNTQDLRATSNPFLGMFFGYPCESSSWAPFELKDSNVMTMRKNKTHSIYGVKTVKPDEISRINQIWMEGDLFYPSRIVHCLKGATGCWDWQIQESRNFAEVGKMPVRMNLNQLGHSSSSLELKISNAEFKDDLKEPSQEKWETLSSAQKEVLTSLIQTLK